MDLYVKCIKCEFRYVTDKARESFVAEGLQGDALLCLHCIGELTGKMMNAMGYLVRLGDMESQHTRTQVMPRTITGCRPCMKRRGG